jgi:hypothetical protein
VIPTRSYYLLVKQEKDEYACCRTDASNGLRASHCYLAIYGTDTITTGSLSIAGSTFLVARYTCACSSPRRSSMAGACRRRRCRQWSGLRLVRLAVVLLVGSPCGLSGDADPSQFQLHNAALPNFFTLARLPQEGSGRRGDSGNTSADDSHDRRRLHRQTLTTYAQSVSVFQHVHKAGGIMVRRFVQAVAAELEKEQEQSPPPGSGARHDQRAIVAGLTAPSRVQRAAGRRSAATGPAEGATVRRGQIVHGDHAFRYCDGLLLAPQLSAGGGAALNAPPPPPSRGAAHASTVAADCAYWIVLRDPVERAVSDFRYCVAPTRQPWATRLGLWRAGRGDRLCTATGLLHFNDSSGDAAAGPTLVEWVRASCRRKQTRDGRGLVCRLQLLRAHFHSRRVFAPFFASLRPPMHTIVAPAQRDPVCTRLPFGEATFSIS